MKLIPDIRITGAIDEANYIDFASKLDVLDTKSLKRNLIIEICSHGGSADLAFAFVGRMRLSRHSFTTLGNGMVASAATLILAAGDKRLATKETTVMIHEDSIRKLSGKVSEIEEQAIHMRQMEIKWNTLLAEYSNKNGRDGFNVAYYNDLHSQGDTYLTPEQAKEHGFIDDIV